MKQNKKNNLSAEELDDLSFDEYDEVINPEPEDCEFDAIVEPQVVIANDGDLADLDRRVRKLLPQRRAT